MVTIEINEESGRLLVNAPALLLLTDEEYTYLRHLGQALKIRAASGQLVVKGGHLCRH